MSASQIALFERSSLWKYNRGIPNRRGLTKYTHLIRSERDPTETMAHGGAKYDDAGNLISGRDPLHWKKTKSVEEFKKGILELLEDGEPRTFNAICVELTGTTADVWFDKPIDQALWALVKDETLAWSNSEGAVFFLLSKFVKWS